MKKGQCEVCGSTEELTRHHTKAKNGEKTGIRKILCRTCHDWEEWHYRRIGIVTTALQKYTRHMRKKIRPVKLQFLKNEPLLPFYASQ